jgi:hypothetical protein
MSSSTTKSAQQLLDEVNRLAQVEGFDTKSFLDQLGSEVAEDNQTSALEARDLQLRAALSAIDTFAIKAMRIRINHLLADDASVPPRFRTYLASRVLDYEGDLDPLRARVAQVAARVDPDGAGDIAVAVSGAAGEVLALRARLRQGVLAMLPEEPPPEEPSEEAPTPDFFEFIELD